MKWTRPGWNVRWSNSVFGNNALVPYKYKRPTCGDILRCETSELVPNSTFQNNVEEGEAVGSSVSFEDKERHTRRLFRES